MKHQATRRFYWLFLLLLAALATHPGNAQRKRKMVKGNTEQGMVFRIESCLANEDPTCYMSLFPDMDTFSKMVMAYTDSSSREFIEMAALQMQATRMLEADSAFHERLKKMFDATIVQGKEEGVHWSSMIPVRYELVKAMQTRNAMYEKLAPNRFTGYYYMQDAVTRKTYAFVVSEMIQIGEEWYGGYVGEIYEAGNKDDYEAQQVQARKDRKAGKVPEKSAKEDVPEESKGEVEANTMQKQVAERKFYTGKFDNEIPVQLYVRSLKGTCKEGICSWEAMYKFGDQDDYILLTVTREEDGDWIFTEVPPNGNMELKLKGNKYTGNWTASDNQTGYDVKLTEAPASDKKVATLDEVFMDLRKSGGKKEEE